MRVSREAGWHSRFAGWCLALGGVVLMALAGEPPAMVLPGDWPQFLGPHRDGTSTETGLLDGWAAAGPAVVWERSIGTGYGAPSVLGNHLVFHHRMGTEEIVECVDATRGAPLWKHAYATHFEDPYGYNNGPRSTPLLTATRCYTFGAEGRLVCLDLATGNLIWERDTAKEWEVPPAFFGVGSSPVMAENRLLVQVGGQPNAGLVALDPEKGTTLWESVGETNWTGVPMTGWPGEAPAVWKRWEKQASYATPVLAQMHGRPIAFCLTRQGLVALDPATGKVGFSRWFRARVDESVNAANPVVVDDLVFFSGAYYKVGSVLLRVKPDRRSFDEVWSGTSFEAHWSTPIYHQGFLYGFSGRNEPDARFRCVEFKTGKLKWERDERWRPHSTPTPNVYGRGSLILADGRLIVLGEGGLLGLFRLNPEAPEELARFQVPGLHHPVWAAPVLARKRLYIRSEDRLVCLDFRAGSAGR